MKTLLLKLKKNTEKYKNGRTAAQKSCNFFKIFSPQNPEAALPRYKRISMPPISFVFKEESIG